MMRLLDNLQYKTAINRHIHHDAYKVLVVLIPDSVQQLPALFKFRLQFMDLFAKQIHGITISFIQALKLIIPSIYEQSLSVKKIDTEFFKIGSSAPG